MRRRRFPAHAAPKTERELCDQLRAAVGGDAVVYPEQGGWDLLLVMEDGLQVGIQAKLKANPEVLAQAIYSGDQKSRRIGGRWVKGAPRLTVPGPDFRVVLVVRSTDAFATVAEALGVGVIEQADLGTRTQWAGSLMAQIASSPRWAPSSRVWLPPFVPDLPAGVPAPRSVTKWKVGAAKLCAALRDGKTFNVKELEAFGAGTLSRWRPYVTGVEGTRPRRYRLIRFDDGSDRLPDREFPEVAQGLGLPWWCRYTSRWHPAREMMGA